MDKVREGFEKFYSKRNQYGEAHKQELWEVWKASRESIVVKLHDAWYDGSSDDYHLGYDSAILEIKHKLDYLGVKYE